MTPKEKAMELYKNFHYQICNDCGISESDSTEFAAKQCALIAVDEILKVAHPYEIVSSAILKGEIDQYCEEYWQSVKSEIEKL